MDLVVELDKAAEFVGVADSPVGSLPDLGRVLGDAVVEVDELRLGVADLGGESCDPLLQLSSLAAVSVPPDRAELIEVLFGLPEPSLRVPEALLGATLLVEEAPDVHGHVGRLRAELFGQAASLVPQGIEG